MKKNGEYTEPKKEGKVFSYEEQQEALVMAERKRRQAELESEDPQFQLDKLNNGKN